MSVLSSPPPQKDKPPALAVIKHVYPHVQNYIKMHVNRCRPCLGRALFHVLLRKKMPKHHLPDVLVFDGYQHIE